MVVRGIVTDVWEPDRDALLSQYIFGSFIGYSLIALSIAWQIRSWGDWAKGLPLTVAVLTMMTEAALLGVLAATLQRDHAGSKEALWPALHIACVATRVVLLILAVLTGTRLFQHTTFAPIADAAPSASYGTFGNGETVGNGDAAPASAPKPAAAPPAPPTLRDFAARIRLLSPYLWPSKSKTLQAVAVVCALIVVVGRFVNVLVPRQLGLVVADLTEDRSPWTNLGIFVGLRFLQGGGGILNALQSTLWVSVAQYSDRAWSAGMSELTQGAGEMTLMCFSHLLNLSLAYHTRRKTGEVLRVLDRGSAINSFFQVRHCSIESVERFCDMALRRPRRSVAVL